MNNKIAIVGCKGFGKEVLQMLRDINLAAETWDILGFFDDSYNHSIATSVNGLPVLGSISDLNAADSNLNVVIAIGNTDTYKIVYDKISREKFSFPNVLHPTSRIDATNILGKGNVIAQHVILTCNISIGNFNSFNVFSCIGHDVRIGSFNVIGPKVQISGSVSIGDGNQFGLCSGVLQDKRIGNDNFIGGFSFVIRNLNDSGRYFGIPATVQKF